MKYLYLILLGFIAITCNKEKIYDGPNYMEDDFENYSALEDLLIPDDELWSFTQLTREGNAIAVDSSFAHSGNKSLLFTAAKSDNEGASKTSLAKQNMAFWKGETVRISAWYYLEGNQKLDWIFLLDLEEQTAIGAGPGMRLALVDNQLRVEHKFNEKDITQTTAIDFPRDEWVEIVWEVKLNRKKKGTVKLWQNGELIIDSKENNTLPKDLLYFQQGTKGMYSSCEIGITANSSDNAARLWIDDIKFEKVD